MEQTKITAGELIGELTYINYKYNRLRSPDISPERWKVVFGNAVDEIETRLTNEMEAEPANEQN